MRELTGGGHGNPLHYSCQKNLMDRGAWRATAHRVTKSQTWLKWLSMQACIVLQLTKSHLFFYLFSSLTLLRTETYNNRTICNCWVVAKCERSKPSPVKSTRDWVGWQLHAKPGLSSQSLSCLFKQLVQWPDAGASRDDRSFSSCFSRRLGDALLTVKRMDRWAKRCEELKLWPFMWTTSVWARLGVHTEWQLSASACMWTREK